MGIGVQLRVRALVNNKKEAERKRMKRKERRKKREGSFTLYHQQKLAQNRSMS